MQDICTRGKGKKLLDPLKERYRIGKKWKKDYRPHMKPQARRNLGKLQLTGELQCRRQSAWTNKEKETKPIMARIKINGQVIQVLIDSGADKNHIHWKMVQQL